MKNGSPLLQIEASKRSAKRLIVAACPLATAEMVSMLPRSRPAMSSSVLRAAIQRRNSVLPKGVNRAGHQIASTRPGAAGVTPGW